MGISRDADFPTEAANLMAAMNGLCEGHAVDTVVMASANMFAAAIHNSAKLQGCTTEEFEALAEKLLGTVYAIALGNWDRAPKASDVAVVKN